ncbi:MAG: hypothetical protein ABEI32_12235, partial [Halothece sp.]
MKSQLIISLLLASSLFPLSACATGAEGDPSSVEEQAPESAPQNSEMPEDKTKGTSEDSTTDMPSDTTTGGTAEDSTTEMPGEAAPEGPYEDGASTTGETSEDSTT